MTLRLIMFSPIFSLQGLMVLSRLTTYWLHIQTANPLALALLIGLGPVSLLERSSVIWSKWVKCINVYYSLIFYSSRDSDLIQIRLNRSALSAASLLTSLSEDVIYSFCHYLLLECLRVFYAVGSSDIGWFRFLIFFVDFFYVHRTSFQCGTEDTKL